MKAMSYTNSVDLEVQDVSKYHPSTPTSITTISSITASGGIPLATTSIINPKVTSSASATNSTIHSVDKIIEFPSLMDVKSHQQQQHIIDVTTINHGNNITLTNHGYSFSSSSVSGKLDAAPLQLNPSYNSVASLTSNDKAKTYSNKPPNVS